MYKLILQHFTEKLQKTLIWNFNEMYMYHKPTYITQGQRSRLKQNMTFVHFSVFFRILHYILKNIKMFALMTVAYLPDLIYTIFIIKVHDSFSKNDLRLTFDLTFDLLCCHLGTTVLASANMR